MEEQVDINHQLSESLDGRGGNSMFPLWGGLLHLDELHVYPLT